MNKFAPDKDNDKVRDRPVTPGGYSEDEFEEEEKDDENDKNAENITSKYVLSMGVEDGGAEASSAGINIGMRDEEDDALIGTSKFG